MNKIWPRIIIFSLIIAITTGNIENIGNIILNSSTKAFELFIKIGVLLLFWSGIFQIAIDSGIINRFSKLMIKPLRKLFPELSKDSKAFEYISANMLANILGLGSAATPLGLKAMKAIKDEVGPKCSRSMITLVAINCSSLTLLPTTIISLRSVYNGSTNISIIFLMMVATMISTIIAIILDRIFYLFEGRSWS